jgi:hypothetical protein
MEVQRSSETPVDNKPTRRHIPEDGILHRRRRENLKSYKYKFLPVVLYTNKMQFLILSEEKCRVFADRVTAECLLVLEPFLNSNKHGYEFSFRYSSDDRLCGLVVRVLGYRSGGPGSIPGPTRFSNKKKRKQ